MFQEMAKIFWRFGDNYQAKALIAMRMYTTMGEQFSNMDPEVLEEYIQLVVKSLLLSVS